MNIELGWVWSERAVRVSAHCIHLPQRQQLMNYKARDADRLNEENEVFRK